jgi:hypothetical protein
MEQSVELLAEETELLEESLSLCLPQIPDDLGSNPGPRGGKPATNDLSYDTASRHL